MAGHLAHAGFEMTVADISPGVASKFVARNGGKVAESLSSLGSTVEAVITMLPTGLIVRDVLVGGVLESLAPGSIVIDMSTSNPFDTRVTAEKTEAHGISMIDCAVAGVEAVPKPPSHEIAHVALSCVGPWVRGPLRSNNMRRH